MARPPKGGEKIVGVARFVDLAMKYRGRLQVLFIQLKHVSNIFIPKDKWEFMSWESSNLQPPFLLNIYEYYSDFETEQKGVKYTERAGNEFQLTAPALVSIEATIDPPLPDGTKKLILDPTKSPYTRA